MDVHSFLKGWLEDLKEMNDGCIKLFYGKFVHKFLESNNTILKIPLGSNFFYRLVSKLSLVKELIQKQSDTIPLYLLAFVDPFIRKHYRSALTERKTIKEIYD
jgi:hypothetical protein